MQQMCRKSDTNRLWHGTLHHLVLSGVNPCQLAILTEGLLSSPSAGALFVCQKCSLYSDYILTAFSTNHLSSSNERRLERFGLFLWQMSMAWWLLIRLWWTSKYLVQPVANKDIVCPFLGLLIAREREVYDLYRRWSTGIYDEAYILFCE